MRRRTTPTAVAVETKRCAIYTRKSTTIGLEQDFNSLDAQREACLGYIQRQLDWILVDERYDDGGFTGANTDRPAFQRLMADVEAKKVDVIVVYKVDRLSRSLLDFVKVMERLNAASASFVSVTQNFSTADAMGRLTLNMLMSFAEFERSMIAERTRDKIAMARRRGKWTGGPIPFGYDAKDKRLLVNEVEAHVVREAFEMFLQHRQMATVARLLNERGLVPRGSKRRAKHGLRWTRDSISRLLRSPLYAGYMMYGEELYPGEHPRILDEATFRAAQRILERGERELHFHGINHDYVLRGLIHCGLCGSVLVPASTRRGTTEYRYYRCSSRDKHGQKVCAAKQLPAAAIEEFVAQRIMEGAQDGGLAASVKDALEKRIRSERTKLEGLRSSLPERVATASSNAAKYADELARLDGRAREIVEAKLRTEGERLAAAERQLAEVERGLEDLAEAKADADWVACTLREFGNVWSRMTPENRGRLMRALVASVHVDEPSGTVEVHLVNFAADPDAKRLESASHAGEAA